MYCNFQNFDNSRRKTKVTKTTMDVPFLTAMKMLVELKQDQFEKYGGPVTHIRPEVADMVNELIPRFIGEGEMGSGKVNGRVFYRTYYSPETGNQGLKHQNDLQNFERDLKAQADEWDCQIGLDEPDNATPASIPSVSLSEEILGHLASN